MRMRSAFLAGCIVLSLPGLAASSLYAAQAWAAWQSAQEAARGVLAAKETMSASVLLMAERGRLYDAAAAANPNADVLVKAGAASDRALERTVGALRAARLPAAVVSRARQSLSAVRSRMEAALRKPSAFRASTQQYSRIVEELEEETSRIERSVTLANPAVGMAVKLARNANELRGIAGTRGAMVSSWLSGQDLQTAQKDEILGLNGRLAEAWDSLLRGIRASGSSPALEQAVANTTDEFFMRKEPWYRELIAAAVAGADRPMALTQYRAWTAAAMDGLLPLRDALIDEATAQGEAAMASARRGLLLSVAVAAASMGLALAAVIGLLRGVVDPVRKMTAAMTALAAGDLAARAPQGSGLREIGAMAAAVAVFRDDVDRRHRSEQLLSHMARHDTLTGLPNRLMLREHMDRVLAPGNQGGGGTAVLYLDLDGFKSVNDTLGHPAGDELLRLVAGCLRASTRDTELVARLGGDEFAVVQTGVEQPASAAALAARLVEAIRTPFDLGGQQASIGTSVGIAVASGPEATADEMLRTADIALYRAKASGRGVWRFFEPGMDAELQQRRGLEADLREALAAEQFEVHYQPLVEARNRTLTGFEALVRWRHPGRGLMLPGEFIPLAEETGLVRLIGAWVLARACADAAGWPAHLRVAVNLSPVQFAAGAHGGDLAGHIEGALAASGLPPHRLELEITESVLLREDQAVVELLHRLRGLGVRIAMDDFGTGYSSLSYLRAFPFDKIKLDRSFVRDLERRDRGGVEIVRAVVGLGKALGMSVLAEGVETEAQFAIVREERCDEVQGFLFSKPRPVAELPGIIARHSFPAGDAVSGLGGPMLVVDNTGKDGTAGAHRRADGKERAEAL